MNVTGTEYLLNFSHRDYKTVDTQHQASKTNPNVNESFDKGGWISVEQRYKYLDPREMEMISLTSIDYDNRIDNPKFYLGEPKQKHSKTLSQEDRVGFYPLCLVGPSDIVRSFLIDCAANDYIINSSLGNLTSRKRTYIFHGQSLLNRNDINEDDKIQSKFQIFRGCRHIYDQDVWCSYTFWSHWLVNSNGTCGHTYNQNDKNTFFKKNIAIEFYIAQCNSQGEEGKRLNNPPFFHGAIVLSDKNDETQDEYISIATQFMKQNGVKSTDNIIFIQIQDRLQKGQVKNGPSLWKIDNSRKNKLSIEKKIYTFANINTIIYQVHQIMQQADQWLDSNKKGCLLM